MACVEARKASYDGIVPHPDDVHLHVCVCGKRFNHDETVEYALKAKLLELLEKKHTTLLFNTPGYYAKDASAKQIEAVPVTEIEKMLEELS